MKSRRFVIGDIHGAHMALVQCLKKSGFDYENDLLISLGDICDGWPDTASSFEELLKIKNLILIVGNHDLWMINWLEKGIKEDTWLINGGQATLDSYPEGIPETHHQLLKKSLDYYLLDDKLFVHAGILPTIPIEEQTRETFCWDRKLATIALLNLELFGESIICKEYESVYVGHTPIHKEGYLTPLKSGNVWLMDTGAGWTGVLSMMDIDTGEHFTSSPVPELYPDHPGRTKRKE